MSDLLGEALARWSIGLENNDDEAVVLAAARNWHTLTNDPKQAYLTDTVIRQAVDGVLAAAVLDALTDTAE